MASELAKIVAAWPSLSLEIRSAVIAIILSASPTSEKERTND
jgi:hypothetical protein